MDPIEVVDDTEGSPSKVSRAQAIEALHLLRSVILCKHLSWALRKQAFADYLEVGG